MHNNRITNELRSLLTPRPQQPASRHESFVPCPAAVIQAFGLGMQSWQWVIYQMAFEQAQAVVRPSLLERDLLAVWN